LAADRAEVWDWHAAHPIPGKLFLVGDPKQSIYRFRRADVSCYEEVKKRLLALGAQLLHLTTSFRAPPSIQRFINSAFASAMTADTESGEAAYVPLARSRDEVAEQPTIIALPVPAPYSQATGWVTQAAIEASLPDAVGAFVEWLVNESGWTITERETSVAIRPRHIAILFRRFQSRGIDITRPYVRALEARRISHVLVGGRSFHHREEVIALRNALTAIEWPDDELKVFATLRGPFFALSDEALLSFRQYIEGDTLKTRRLHPLHGVELSELPGAAREVLDALAVLRELHARRNERPIAHTISALLETLRAHAGIALWRNGEQALANCQRLIDMARRFERTTSSFRAFVEKIETDAEHAEADEASIVEEGTEGVRLMTVFKAKGLEFPVVILADPTCPASHKLPSRHIDPGRRVWLEAVCMSAPIELVEARELEIKRDRAEAVRIAYVAATRARDLLIVPTCGDKPIKGWLEVLNPMLYPQDERHTSQRAPGCPMFGNDSVRTRPPNAPGPPDVTPVCPGLHHMGTDPVRIVWWDPSVVTLDVEEQAPLRAQRILQIDPGGAAATASEQQYRAWQQERQELLDRAARPLLTVHTVTALAHGATRITSTETETTSGTASSVRIERVKRHGPERPGGRRFGAFVHTLLASLDLKPTVETIEALASGHGKTFGATMEEIRAAVGTVEAALAHPVLQRAAASNDTRRETPVLLRLHDGSLAEGTVDLAFREDPAEFVGWTVVDFKTDREFAASSNRYVAQVELYVRAVSAATTAPARGILLIV
jgi:ATP-dependent helicase/nuclease subunit A